MESKNYRRPDSQWKCGRSSDGEGCPLGPDQRGRCQSQQCHPKRTLRWWRSYLQVAFAVATIGIVVCLKVTQQHREVIAPGPLSMAHAQLIHNPSDPHRCASCHEDSANQFSNSTMDNGIAAVHTQTQRCMACHLRELPQLKRSTPHDLPLEQLESMTASATSHADAKRSTWLVSFVRNQPIDWHQHQLACSDCHREHHGAGHDLQAISSQRCQACHQNQFNAFADGHPEFSNYPDPSTGRIAFDHRRHREQHFSKSSAQFDCRTCHVNRAEQGRVGQVFRSVAFETACASCHVAPMKSSLSDGIVVFQLPSIDLQRLAQLGDPIRDWPSEAGQMLDGSVPPWMQLLFMGEKDGNTLIDKLPESGKLSDLNIDDRDNRQAIISLAAASRRLLSRLASGGQQELQKLLVATFDPKDHGLMEQLARGVPPDLFRQAYQDWFEQESRPNLVANGLRVSTERERRTLRDTKDQKDQRDEKDERAVETSENDLLSGSSDSLVGNSLLTDDPVPSDILATDSTSTLTHELEGASTWKPLKAMKHLGAGGWMIDRQRMAIVYIPTGHADPWLTALLTFASQMKDAETHSPSDDFPQSNEKQTSAMMRSILAKDSIGRCLECHQSVDTSGSRPLEPVHLVAFQKELNTAVNQRWRANRFDARIRQLTRFDHGPHLLQSSLTDCAACHRMVLNESVAFGVAHRDFESMTVQDCASCHQPKAAGDNCTQCHHYHTNSIEP